MIQGPPCAWMCFWALYYAQLVSMAISALIPHHFNYSVIKLFTHLPSLDSTVNISYCHIWDGQSYWYIFSNIGRCWIICTDLIYRLFLCEATSKMKLKKELTYHMVYFLSSFDQHKSHSFRQWFPNLAGCQNHLGSF